jgi:uncharacterized membrane protein
MKKSRFIIGITLALGGLWGGAALFHLFGMQSDFAFASVFTGFVVVIAGVFVVISSFGVFD